jgi:hypothetical protein
MLTKEQAQQAPQSEGSSSYVPSDIVPRPVACCILDPAYEVLCHSANVHVDIFMRLSRPSVLLGERLSCMLHLILLMCHVVKLPFEQGI